LPDAVFLASLRHGAVRSDRPRPELHPSRL